jgi:hypothetical protein
MAAKLVTYCILCLILLITDVQSVAPRFRRGGDTTSLTDVFKIEKKGTANEMDYRVFFNKETKGVKGKHTHIAVA